MSSPLWVSVAVLAVPGAGAPEGGVSLRTFSSGAGAAGGAAVPVAVAAAGAAVFEAPGAALAPPVVAPPVVAEAVSPFACLSAVVWLSAVAGGPGALGAGDRRAGEQGHRGREGGDDAGDALHEDLRGAGSGKGGAGHRAGSGWAWNAPLKWWRLRSSPMVATSVPRASSWTTR